MSDFDFDSGEDELETDAEKGEKLQKRIERMMVADMKSVLSTESGKRIIFHLIEHSGVFGTQIADTARSTDYNCGMRDHGLYLLKIARESDPEVLTDGLGNRLDYINQYLTEEGEQDAESDDG